MRILILAGLLMASPIMSLVLGYAVAWLLKVPWHGWRFAPPLFFAFASLIVVAATWPPRLGMDLAGGTVLVYEINTASGGERHGVVMGSDGAPAFSVDDLVRAVQRRVNPGGVREVVVRHHGDSGVEILLPKIDADQLEWIKKTISTSGFLEFLIVANSIDHGVLMVKATGPDADPEATVIRDHDRTIGRWVKAASIRKGFFYGVVPIVVVNATLLFCGAAGYVIGTDQMRGLAFVAFFGSMATFVTCVLCLWLLLGALAARSRAAPQKAG